MLNSTLNVILGLSEVIAIIVFSAAYSLVCMFFGWIPDLSFKNWALITAFFSLIVLSLSLGLWLFTSYKESIHAWILLPGIVGAKIWISTSHDTSFGSLLSGSIIICLLCMLLVLGEAMRTWFSNKPPKLS